MKSEAMTAARLTEPGAPLSIDRIDVPRPEPDEVLVEVKACGLCGTDLHLAVEGTLPVAFSPITLGHEVAGEIVAAGDAVADDHLGRRVALYPAAFCGNCFFCARGRQSLCERTSVYGMQRNGGLAQYVTAPARSVVHLPEGIPFDQGAIATDAVATPFHALRTRGKLRAGETVGVYGCGGLGTHAILLARLMGASSIVAVDTDPAALERARGLGADIAIDPATEDAPRAIRRALPRSGLDLALEFVGSAATVEMAIRSLGVAGRAVVVGIGPDKPSLPRLASFVGRQQAVLGSFGMDLADITDLVALIESGRLDLYDSISHRFPLEEANDALQHLARKEAGVVRVVVEP